MTTSHIVAEKHSIYQPINIIYAPMPSSNVGTHFFNTFWDLFSRVCPTPAFLCSPLWSFNHICCLHKDLTLFVFLNSILLPALSFIFYYSLLMSFIKLNSLILYTFPINPLPLIPLSTVTHIKCKWNAHIKNK